MSHIPTLPVVWIDDVDVFQASRRTGPDKLQALYWHVSPDGEMFRAIWSDITGLIRYYTRPVSLIVEEFATPPAPEMDAIEGGIPIIEDGPVDEVASEAPPVDPDQTNAAIAQFLSRKLGPDEDSAHAWFELPGGRVTGSVSFDLGGE